MSKRNLDTAKELYVLIMSGMTSLNFLIKNLYLGGRKVVKNDIITITL